LPTEKSESRKKADKGARGLKKLQKGTCWKTLKGGKGAKVPLYNRLECYEDLRNVKEGGRTNTEAKTMPSGRG